MGFEIINKETTPVEPYALTVEKKKALTDVFIQSTSLEDYYHKTVLAGCHYDRTAITSSYNKKIAINKHVLKLMRCEVLISEAEYETNEDTGETVCNKEAVYNTQPTSLTILRTEAYLAFPDCSKTAFDYNVGKIVDWSDGTGTCDFNQFKTYFNEQD